MDEILSPSGELVLGTRNATIAARQKVNARIHSVVMRK